MISVIIATHDSERSLVPTLAALVPGAMAAVVREVIVADAGSSDGTAVVADASGCRFMVSPAPLGARLKAAAALARGPWLLFMRPGTVPDITWVGEVGRFLEGAELAEETQAATFRRAGASGRRPMLIEALSLIGAALGARPRPEQGLLISKQHYDALGGHAGNAADAEADFIGRIERRRIVLLRSGATRLAV